MLKTIKYKYLIKQFKNRIYSYSILMLKNKMDADDVSQEVMIRLWNNMDSFRIDSAQSWIMRTTHNICIDVLRKRKISFERESFFDEDNFTMQAPDPARITEAKNLNDNILEALKLLPEKLRSVFILYQFQEMKYEEISKILEIPINSVKVYLLRARKKLQEELKEYAY